MKVGIVGCGKISDIYLKNCHQRFPGMQVAAVADLVTEYAQAKADQYAIPKVLPVDELIADPEVEAVLNLTIPAAHAEICEKTLLAGKHSFTEKPLAIDFQDGKRLVDLAAEKGVRLGSAPDTFLGGGLQTVRKLLDDGWIGSPVAATAFMTGRGPEGWHPNPHFFYQRGAGPLFDMGPYYITALVTLLGPVRRLSAATRITFKERVATSKERYGERIPVEVPTHVAGTLEFASGAIGTLVVSFDVWKSRLPRIDLFGSLGSIGVPDPNTFWGPVQLFRPGADDWAEVPLSHGYAENSRGVGLLDMVRAAESGRPHRANGEVALHVLEVMHGLLESGETGAFYDMTTTCERPAALPVGLNDGELD